MGTLSTAPKFVSRRLYSLMQWYWAGVLHGFPHSPYCAAGIQISLFGCLIFCRTQLIQVPVNCSFGGMEEAGKLDNRPFHQKDPFLIQIWYDFQLFLLWQARGRDIVPGQFLLNRLGNDAFNRNIKAVIKRGRLLAECDDFGLSAIWPAVSLVL